mgnify:CR=1 FL=1
MQAIAIREPGGADVLVRHEMARPQPAAGQVLIRVAAAGVNRPDILIVEGLNVLQPARLPRGGAAIPFVSDFFDFSIYLDADPKVIEEWYIARFMRLRQTAFRDPAAYFHRYATLTNEAAEAKALEIWRSINLKNLEDNILPTRQRARLILRKGANHKIEQVELRKT